MIPVVSIFNLISALFFLSISLKLYLSYRKSKNEALRDFLLAFLFFTILLTFITTPGIIFTDLETIGFVYAIYPLFAFLALAYLGSVPLKILEWKRVKKVFFHGLVGIAFLITILNIISCSSASIHQQNQFVYWEDTRGAAMDVIIGVVFAVSLVSVIIFFLIQGFKSLERFIRIRSLLIAGGLLFLTLAAVVNFVVGASEQIYLTSLLANLFNILAAFFLLLGIYYKPKNYAKSDR